VTRKSPRTLISKRPDSLLAWQMKSLRVSSEAASQRLDDQLCFAVYSTAHALQRIYSRLLKQHDLTYTRYLVMLVLWERNALTVSEIGERLFLDSGTTTPLLKQLERSGLITRLRSASDERQVIVSLTESGRTLQESCSSIPNCIADAMKIGQQRAKNLQVDLEMLRTNIDLSDLARPQ